MKKSSALESVARNVVINLLSEDESDSNFSESDEEVPVNLAPDRTHSSNIFDVLGVRKCWACEKDFDHDKVMNLIHPLLHLNCCSNCMKEISAAENDVQSIIRKNQSSVIIKRKRRKYTDDSDDRSSSNDEVEVCSGCAGMIQDQNQETDYDLLLCDSCPRAFCLRCIALAHYDGDIKTAWSIAEDYCQSHCKVWRCIYCCPTSELLNKQRFVEPITQENALGPKNHKTAGNIFESIDDDLALDQVQVRRQRDVNTQRKRRRINDTETKEFENQDYDVDFTESVERHNMREENGDNDCHMVMGTREEPKGSDMEGTIQQCYACDIQLDEKITSSDDDNEAGKKMTYMYSMHMHPILRLPCCSSCVNELVAVELDAQCIIGRKQGKLQESDTSDEGETSDDASCALSEMDTCSGCAGRALDKQGEDFDLVLCDECPRVFCTRCVAMAHGGDVESAWLKVEQLIKSNDPWKCIYCEPTPELTRLQLQIPRPDISTNARSTERHMDSEAQDKETNTLLNDLLALELKKEEAEQMLEETSIQNQRDLILQEMMELFNGKLTMDVIRENVEAELVAWIDHWETHHTRLAENIGILHDTLCCPEHNVDLVAFYHDIDKDLNEGSNLRTTSASEEKEGDVPSWKREADKALSDRDKRLGYAPGVFIGASGYKGNEESYIDFDELLESEIQDIEDINTLEDTLNVQEAIVNRNGEVSIVRQWGSTSFSERDVQRFKTALAEEDRELKLCRITLPTATMKDDLLDDVSLVRRKLCSDNLPRPIVFREFKQCIEQHRPAQRKKCAFDVKAVNNSTHLVVSRRKVNFRRVLLKRINRPDRPNSVTYTKEQKVSLDDYGYTEFQDSSVILGKYGGNIVSIANPIAKALKSHQVSGVRFMYDSICSDLHSENCPAKADVNGCILVSNDNCNDTYIGAYLFQRAEYFFFVSAKAHCMGLGKTLQTIALLHCLLTHPSLVKCKDLNGMGEIRDSQRLIQRVLVIVPVNVLVNWQNELAKWVDNLAVPKIPTYNLNNMPKNATAREDEVKRTWGTKGGILFTSGQTLLTFLKPVIDRKDEFPYRYAAFFSPGPDVIVLDEAHLLLKSDRTATSKILTVMETKRRISLTGTPFANNLMEYYRMVNWAKPDHLGASTDFEIDYVKPIVESLNADASKLTMTRGDRLLKELALKLSPLISRAGSDVLVQDLNFIQQAVIHVRQTKLQVKLQKAFQRFREETANNKFFFAYKNLSPVNNHPGCLLEKPIQRVKEGEIDEPDAEADDSDNDALISNAHDVSSHDKKDDQWWQDVFSKSSNFASIKNGNKAVVLLHILAHAEMIGDKVLLFSQCLRTLDFLEKVLQTEDWSSHVPSIEFLVPGRRWGSWKKNIDYLRIDGSTSSALRGSLVDQFSNRDPSATDVKLFLISSRAGGVGINLVSANRVILFDSNFNPAIDVQAVFRCYRYGQEKPVFVYRLLTEGTLEEKVYSRSVNKTSLFLRAVDQKHPERNFTASELANMLDNNTWVQCDTCDKWRMLPPEADVANLPDKWYCHLNIHDPDRSTCDALEVDDKFYDAFFASRYLENGALNQSSSTLIQAENSTSSRKDEAEIFEWTKRDDILSHLLDCFSKEKDGDRRKRHGDDIKSNNGLISKYYFHDSLFRDQVNISVSNSQSFPENDLSHSITNALMDASSEVCDGISKMCHDDNVKIDIECSRSAKTAADNDLVIVDEPEGTDTHQQRGCITNCHIEKDEDHQILSSASSTCSCRSRNIDFFVDENGVIIIN